MDASRNNPIIFGIGMMIFTYISMPTFPFFALVMGIITWSFGDRFYKQEANRYGT